MKITGKQIQVGTILEIAIKDYTEVIEYFLNKEEDASYRFMLDNDYTVVPDYAKKAPTELVEILSIEEDSNKFTYIMNGRRVSLNKVFLRTNKGGLVLETRRKYLIK